MIKTAIALAAAAPLMAAPALAGPYVNVEANSGFTGSDYTGTTTDAHVGYAGDAGAVSYGAQIGPSFVVTDGGESDTVLSGKVYASVAATEALSVYGGSPSLVALMMLTTVMALRSVQPGVSDI